MKDEEHDDRNSKIKNFSSVKNNSRIINNISSQLTQRTKKNTIESTSKEYMTNKKKMNDSKSLLNLKINSTLLVKAQIISNSTNNLISNSESNNKYNNNNCDSSKSLIEQSLIDRNENWLKIREQRLKELQKKVVEKEMKNCSFRPTMVTNNKIYNV